MTTQHDYSQDYLTLEIITSGGIDLDLYNFYYSKNDGPWIYVDHGHPYISCQIGDTIRLKGNNDDGILQGSCNRISYIGGNAKFNVSGNPMSLFMGDNFGGITSLDIFSSDFGDTVGFAELFIYSNVVSAANLSLHFTTLIDACYFNMFCGCSYLTIPPLLPATTLADNCYHDMFKDCTSLVTPPALPATTLANHCYEGMFDGCTSLTTAPILPATTLEVGCYFKMFSGCTSLTTAPILPATTMIDAIEEASNYFGCYGQMFAGCTSLTTAPILPATTLGSHCYEGMFGGCSSLISPPSLQATTLSECCYAGMFMNCTSLTTAPVLPATTLVNSCYSEMFFGCTSLNYIKCFATEAADISAQNCTYNWTYDVASTGTFVKSSQMPMEDEEYEDDNYWCVGYDGIPSGWEIYDSKFKNQQPLTFKFTGNNSGYISCNYDDVYCSLDNGSSWEQFSDIYINPGDVLLVKGDVKDGSLYSDGWFLFDDDLRYNVSGNIMSVYDSFNFDTFTNFNDINDKLGNVFSGMVGLVSAENLILPATTLSESCYSNMFSGCTSLTTAPELPAQTLSEYCYDGMFEGCTSLTTAPELPATTLADGCYQEMFRGCTSLNHIKCLATNISARNCTTNWVYNVASTGTFRRPKSMSSWTTGNNGIPTGWIIENDYSLEYLTLEIIEGGSIYVNDDYDIYFSLNGGEWDIIGYSDHQFNAGDVVRLKGELDYLYVSSGGYITGDAFFNVYGNPLSLLEGDNFGGITSLERYEDVDSPLFESLFSVSNVVSAANLSLHFTTLSEYCYSNMFSGCTSLTTAPELPATTLVDGCYNYMFYGCTSLTTAPELPATTLADNCYEGMFNECTSLTSAPELPAQTLSESCYDCMFEGCTSLTTVPTLPATSIARFCYSSMFYGCTSLTTVPSLPATTLADNCYSNMFFGCTSLTTVPSLPATTLADGCYSNMFSGCTSLETAPELPAITVSDNWYRGCYNYMFYGCLSLNYIKCLAKKNLNISFNNWVNNVASTGTFVKNPQMTYWQRGVNGIPTGWTILNAGSVTTHPINRNSVYNSGDVLCNSGSGTGTMMYRLGESGNFSSTIPTTNGLNAGTYTLYYYADENSNSGGDYAYAPSSVESITVTVEKEEQPLTISPTAKTIYNRSGYNSFTITSSDAQGDVVYTSSDTSKATVNSSGVVTYVGPGSVTITVTAAGNDNYKSGSKTCAVTCVVDSVSSYGTPGQPTITQILDFPADGVTLTTSNISTYFSHSTVTQGRTWVSGYTDTIGVVSYTWTITSGDVASLGTTETSTTTSNAINCTITATGEGNTSSSKTITSGSQEANTVTAISLTVGESTILYGESTTTTVTATYKSGSSGIITSATVTSSDTTVAIVS